MRDAVSVIAEHLATWDVPFVERDVFGSVDPHHIASVIDRFAREHLGAGVAGYLFQTASISSVHGVVLDDGREVVIKAKPPAETNRDMPLDRGSLEAIATVQQFLCDAGFPCPRPLLGATTLGHGLATVETYLPPGDVCDAHQPAIRRILARGLDEHMRLLDAMRDPRALLRHFALPTESLFPQPHSKLFTPSEPDTVWVRDLARRARAIAEAVPSPVRLAHCDWKIEHVQLRGETIVATYDWDSLALLPETRLVGTAAHGHTADWSRPGIRPTPTYAEIIGFIADYEDARGEAFDAAEHAATRAWATYLIAYGAWISINPANAHGPTRRGPDSSRVAGSSSSPERPIARSISRCSVANRGQDRLHTAARHRHHAAHAATSKPPTLSPDPAVAIERRWTRSISRRLGG